jgi:Amt family ammonium transporter
MTSGFSALVAAIMVGKRKGFGKQPMAPHSLPLCLTGAGLLWAGWFGFNAGSALSASPLATLAFLNTSTAASMATLTWAGIEWLHRGKPTALGAATAAVAGLVAITPACGNVSPGGAIAMGFLVSVFCYSAVTFLKARFGYDDSLDAFGVHGVGGTFGAIGSGLFATVFGAGIETRSAQLMVQLEGVVIVAIFAPLATFILLKVLGALFGGLRVDDESEFNGLDLSEHHEAAYTMGGGPGE